MFFVMVPVSFFLSPGGYGMGWRTQTCGTTVGSTTSQEPGYVHPPKKLVNKDFSQLLLPQTGAHISDFLPKPKSDN